MKDKISMPKIKDLYAPVDYFGKTFIVSTITREDLKGFFSPYRWKHLQDNDISNIARKLADVLTESYWDALYEVCDYYNKSLERRKKCVRLSKQKK